ncbi:hypothetical protein [Pleionea litopenaei]|uniref:Uncharacterized protein n=1 Tax=Pleionea litopenaei TaxID=3070815 RepID=A0AA51X8C7_9GAMM|nr:hypothetical protein [Pleionea sp. HL-JVS1]WMS87970.1 hypothetical protein Q9312_03380 [Pleionea sp. HL-JVS1]
MNKVNFLFFLLGCVATSVIFFTFSSINSVPTIQSSISNIDCKIDDKELKGISESLEETKTLAGSKQTAPSPSSKVNTSLPDNNKVDEFSSSIDRIDADSLDAPTVSANAIKSVFDDETRESAWANIKESSINEIIFSPEFSQQFTSSNVECKASTCKFHLNVDSPEKIIEGITSFAGLSIQNPELAVLEIATNNDLKNNSTVIYLIDRSKHD